MQLRDFKVSIACPGQWGFFGGGLEDGEKPIEAAQRELLEEVCYKPDVMHVLSTQSYFLEGPVLSHAFYCELKVPLQDLILDEGQDFGLFTVDEIASGMLYSRRLDAAYPTIPHEYLCNTVRSLSEKFEVN